MAKISTQEEHHEDPGIGDFGPSLTKQEFLEETDVNNIISQYETDGIAPPGLGMPEPLYADFSAPELSDYHMAMNIVVGAGELFTRLPARTRERFQNDAAQLIAFVQDPKNQKEAHELGLLRDDYVSPSTPPAPLAAPAAPPAPPETK